jgi:hypothetical protein
MRFISLLTALGSVVLTSRLTSYSLPRESMAASCLRLPDRRYAVPAPVQSPALYLVEDASGVTNVTDSALKGKKNAKISATIGVTRRAATQTAADHFLPGPGFRGR